MLKVCSTLNNTLWTHDSKTTDGYRYSLVFLVFLAIFQYLKARSAVYCPNSSTLQRGIEQ